MSTVWYMVDDTDPRLSFSGLWSSIPNATQVGFQTNSSSGVPYNNTLRHVEKDNATITFRFNGSSYLGVFGTLFPDSVLNSHSFNCLLDGGAMLLQEVTGSGSGATNNMLACSTLSTTSSPGEHELLISISNATQWYFDYITFESLAPPATDGDILQAGNGFVTEPTSYSMLSFSPGWSSTVDATVDTDLVGSTVTIKFNGTSVSLYGSLGSNVTNTAAYQVDNDLPVVFELPEVPGASSLQVPIFTNQLLFNVTQLSIGEHTVTVAFNGSKSGMPLDINQFYVTSLTAAEQASLIPASSPLAAPSPAATSLFPIPTSSSSHDIRPKVISGVVLGAVMAVLLLIFCAAIMWKRRKGSKTSDTVHPFPSTVLNSSKNSILKQNLFGNIISSVSPSSLTSSLKKHMKGNRTGHISPENDRVMGTEPGPENFRAMKLEQRLAVLQVQIQQDRQDMEYIQPFSPPNPILHIDSGLRLMVEDPEPVTMSNKEDVLPDYEV